jgi:hypothetical protein
MKNNYKNMSDDELDGLFKAIDAQPVAGEDEGWQKMSQLLDTHKKKPLVPWQRYTALLLLLLLPSIYYFATKNSKSIDKTASNNSKNNNKKAVATTTNNIELAQSKNADKQSQTIEKNALPPITEMPNTTTKTKENKKDLRKDNIKSNFENNSSPTVSTNAGSLVLTQKNSENLLLNTKSKKAQLQKIQAYTNQILLEEQSNATTKRNIKNRLKTKSNKQISSLLAQNTTSQTEPEISPKFNTVQSNNKLKVNEINHPNINTYKPNTTEIDKTSTPPGNNLELPFDVATAQQQLFTAVYLANIAKTKLLPVHLPLPQVVGIQPAPVAAAIPLPSFYQKGLALRLAASPDISMIKGNSVEKIGSNYGLLIDYRFSKRLSLQTGLIRSMKKYEAYPEQYNWTWAKPSTRNPLMDIQAQCKMLDIPINLRYDISQGAQKRIFGTIGITTYKMMEEIYDYNYQDNTDHYIKWKQWKGKTGTYMASNLGLSLGLEQKVAKKISFQAEPFAKVPLKSIGFGKVPLITYGLMFSGKYKLSK